MKADGFHYTGTVRKNRVAGCPLQTQKQLITRGRGALKKKTLTSLLLDGWTLRQSQLCLHCMGHNHLAWPGGGIGRKKTLWRLRDHMLLLHTTETWETLTSWTRASLAANIPWNPGGGIYTGRSPVGRRPAGAARSKITRVRVLSWPLLVRTSLYFLTVMKYWVTCHEILSHEISNERIRIVRVTSTLS